VDTGEGGGGVSSATVLLQGDFEGEVIEESGREAAKQEPTTSQRPPVLLLPPEPLLSRSTRAGEPHQPYRTALTRLQCEPHFLPLFPSVIA
jgi:hypothetical protein